MLKETKLNITIRRFLSKKNYKLALIQYSCVLRFFMVVKLLIIGLELNFIIAYLF